MHDIVINCNSSQPERVLMLRLSHPGGQVYRETHTLAGVPRDTPLAGVPRETPPSRCTERDTPLAGVPRDTHPSRCTERHPP